MHQALTLDDWQREYRLGIAPGPLLRTRRKQLVARGAPVYLHVIDAPSLELQIEALQAMALEFPDRDSLLAAKPLWGIPFVVKDNIDIAGVPTTAACPAFSFIAENNASVVQRLLDAGAVWLAKANLDQFATGLVGTRSPFGAPASVWSDRHISGGSSSGSAVAVASGDVPFSLGTDTAGSGRIPAAFNHIVGLKPTPGRVSTRGIVPACRSLDCPSIFARLVADAAGLLAIVEGEDVDDSFSRFAPGLASLPALLRIGIPALLPASLQPEISAAFETTCDTLRQQGHSIVAVDFDPLFEVASLLYDGPWVAERHLVVRDLLSGDADAIDPTVRQVITQAERFSADDAFEARHRLHALTRPAAQVWTACDVLLVPTTTQHPTFEEVAADPTGVNSTLGLFTNFVNLLGWSALAVPASLSPSGMPIGITFIGQGNHDAALIELGKAWEALAAQPLGTSGRNAAGAAAATLPAPACEAVLPIAVVGAHLSGLPLNHQLTDLGGLMLEATRTAASYRLHALPGTTPRKPGLQRVADGGQAIEMEIWSLPTRQVGRLLELIPAPLGLGSIELADGRSVHGFVCEGFAFDGAQDISRFGGWRAYLASL